MQRRQFIRQAAAVGAGAVVVGASKIIGAESLTAGGGSYGPLGPPDALGFQLPPGFSARIVASTGETVASSSYVWHTAPDGGAIFGTPSGGWIYVSNSEVGNRGGGVGALEFAADGTVVDAYSILGNTSRNCAGGPTPWGTWLSCEEVDVGRVWECDPSGLNAPVVRPALGTFSHEAVAVDPRLEQLYLTEDHPEGRFYRFTPTNYPDLSSGLLEAAAIDGGGAVTWVSVDDPTAASAPTRSQAAGSTSFKGGEGAYWSGSEVVFTTKGDNNVWAYSPAKAKLRLVYNESGPLNGVDNVVISKAGEIFVAEDGGNMELVRLDDGGVVEPFLRITGHGGSEVTGPAFSPDGRRLYLSSQRGATGTGITYEVSGPFAGAGASPPTTTSTSSTTGPSTTAAPSTSATTSSTDSTSSSTTSSSDAPSTSSTSLFSTTTVAPQPASDDGDAGSGLPVVGLVTALGAAGAVGTYMVTRSRSTAATTEPDAPAPGVPGEPPPPPPSR